MHAGRQLILITTALALGALATWLAHQGIQREIAARTRASGAAESRIIVAARDLPPGSPIDVDSLAIRSVPLTYASSDSVPPEQLDSVHGTRTRRALRAGEALLFSALEAARPAGLAAQLQKGRRAMTLAVDEVNSLSGLLRPGDRIDVLAASASDGTPRALLQDVLILATGPRLESPDTAATDSAEHGETHGTGDTYSSITLQLRPEEAGQLAAAQSAGLRLTALLRSSGDTPGPDPHWALGRERSPAGASRRAASRSEAVSLYVGGTGGNGLLPQQQLELPSPAAQANALKTAAGWLAPPAADPVPAATGS